MPMNPEVKAQWTAALKSGDYPQARGYLRTNQGYCCLGVLCELAVKAGIIPQGTPRDSLTQGAIFEYGRYDDELLLPDEVVEWAGIGGNNPDVEMDGLPDGVRWDDNPENGDGAPALANMNDGGTSFHVIAAVIDAQF